MNKENEAREAIAREAYQVKMTLIKLHRERVHTLSLEIIRDGRPNSSNTSSSGSASLNIRLISRSRDGVRGPISSILSG